MSCREHESEILRLPFWDFNCYCASKKNLKWKSCCSTSCREGGELFISVSFCNERNHQPSLFFWKQNMSWVPLFQTIPHSHSLHSCCYTAYFGDDSIINYIMFWIRSIVPSKSKKVLQSLEVFNCLRGHSPETVSPQGWPSSTVTTGPWHSWLIHRGPTSMRAAGFRKKKKKRELRGRGAKLGGLNSLNRGVSPDLPIFSYFTTNMTRSMKQAQVLLYNSNGE